MKGKALKSAAVSGILLASMLAVPFQAVASVDEVISGGTANFDYVFAVTEDETYDFTTEASSPEEDNAVIFPEEDTADQAFYLGMEDAMFDKVLFNLDEAVVLNDEDDEITWEYFDGDDWTELDTEADRAGGMTTVNARYVKFDMPSDWEKTTVEDEEGYFVRLTPGSEVAESGEAEQISARAYTVKVTLYNNNNDEIDDLEEDDFDAENGSDEHVYGVYNAGDGVYYVAMQTEGEDTEYTLMLSPEKYLSRSIAVEPSTSEVPSFTRTLTYRPDWMPEDERGSCPTPFIDIDNHWVQSTVRELYCEDLFTDAAYFKPNTHMQRAEYIKLLLTIAEVDTDYSGDEEYKDVEEGDWYWDYVMTAYDLGIVDDSSYFYPERFMDRAEAVSIAVRLAEELEGVNTDDNVTRFSDVDEDDWYAAYVKTAFNYQLVVGYKDGTFRGENEMTRAEGATVVNNYWYAFVRTGDEVED